MIRFFVAAVPRPGGSKKAFRHAHTGKVIVTDDAKGNREWKAAVSLFAREAYQGPPLTGALRLSVQFLMPRPKSHYRTNGLLKPNAPTWHTKKPDTTKLVRSTEDALNGVLWVDDTLIVRQTAEKVYGDEVGAWVEVTQV